MTLHCNKFQSRQLKYLLIWYIAFVSPVQGKGCSILTYKIFSRFFWWIIKEKYGHNSYINHSTRHYFTMYFRKGPVDFLYVKNTFVIKINSVWSTLPFTAYLLIHNNNKLHIQGQRTLNQEPCPFLKCMIKFLDTGQLYGVLSS